MKKYIVFNIGQIKTKDGRWKYEPNVKYRLTNEDNEYYYIGDDKFKILNNDDIKEVSDIHG